MANARQLPNRVKTRRLDRGWSQAELAARAGISRAAVSAIEINRLVPSVAAALSLARVLGCSVEELFGQQAGSLLETLWAWPPPQAPCRYWQATLGGRTLLYPAETTAAGMLEHDGVWHEGVFHARHRVSPDKTLVMAGCDPAAALLAAEVERLTGLRVLVLPRSSRQALSLLGQGLIHVAGVHLSTRQAPDGNVLAVRDSIGPGFRLLRVARWQEGLVLAPGSGLRSIRAALRAPLRWVGREPGSGARQCLDELLDRRPPPRRLARDHRGVVDAIRAGWADAGVCPRLVGEEAGLRFLFVREEIYELCFACASEGDPRLRALKDAVQSTSYREVLADLPGYDAAECGEMHRVG